MKNWVAYWLLRNFTRHIGDSRHAYAAAVPVNLVREINARIHTRTHLYIRTRTRTHTHTHTYAHTHTYLRTHAQQVLMLVPPLLQKNQILQDLRAKAMGQEGYTQLLNEGRGGGGEGRGVKTCRHVVRIWNDLCHTRTCHGTHMNESRHRCKWVVSHVHAAGEYLRVLCHVTHVNASCQTYALVSHRRCEE